MPVIHVSKPLIGKSDSAWMIQLSLIIQRGYSISAALLLWWKPKWEVLKHSRSSSLGFWHDLGFTSSSLRWWAHSALTGWAGRGHTSSSGPTCLSDWFHLWLANFPVLHPCGFHLSFATSLCSFMSFVFSLSVSFACVWVLDCCLWFFSPLFGWIWPSPASTLCVSALLLVSTSGPSPFFLGFLAQISTEKCVFLYLAAVEAAQYPYGTKLSLIIVNLLLMYCIERLSILSLYTWVFFVFPP